MSASDPELQLMGQIAVNYGAALAIGAAEGRRRVLARRSPFTAVAISANLLLLGLFKYAGFAVGATSNS